MNSQSRRDCGAYREIAAHRLNIDSLILFQLDYNY